MAAIEEDRDYAADFAALGEAMEEVNRMRREVHRLALQQQPVEDAPRRRDPEKG